MKGKMIKIYYMKKIVKKKVQLGVVKEEGAGEGTGRRNCGWNVNK